MAAASVNDYLTSEGPLTQEVALFLIDYKEEDDRADYKLTFDPSDEKHWLGLTKDVSAFSNTFGGYLIFGVTDRSRDFRGLEMKIAEVLEDVNNIQQKLNRYLEPHVERIRSKKFELNDKLTVLIYVPQSIGHTHMISKDGAITHPSGEKKIVLRKGTFYVRRSAANHLGDSRDLDAVFERRVDQFRDALVDKVARVVKAPMDSEVFVLSRDPKDEGAKKFIIEDTPESIPIKGMSFTIPPEGPMEEIAAWSVLSQYRPSTMPSAEIVWSWYATRHELEMSAQHRLSVFKFSLWTDVPAFYWIKGLRTQDIQEILLHAVRHRPNNVQVSRMLDIASFIGKSFYERVLRALGDYRERLAPRQKSFPSQSPKDRDQKFKRKRKQSETQLKQDLLEELNDIANAAATNKVIPELQKRWRTHDIDCYLYAQDDQYKVG